MSADYSMEDGSKDSESWWKNIVRPFAETYLRSECVRQSYELMAESVLVTYLTTRYLSKRPHKAFKYATVALFLVPTTYWPICTIIKKQPPGIFPEEL